ncbi:MAG: UvrD-helicase domain-containing protein, partial [Christensenellaceae bacterium]|nr:UvrD-helicase domain-containing protein [Christensenellaceae bacterium]
AAWREELRDKLVPAEEGLYALGKAFMQKGPFDSGAFEPRYIVTGEISSIYNKNGRVRKVHSVLLLPSLEAADALSSSLEKIGNLHSDGRPILGLDSRDLLEIKLESCPEAMLIPAHIWTPHFSLFGAYSGFDSLEECFEDLSCHIHALETGLSSDPPMNWRLSALDRFAMVSNSDAHSPANLAREANLFGCALSYPGIKKALENPLDGGFRGTIEFFPEEGKYHYDGHRNCGVCQRPADTIASGGVCPVCGGRITVGVLHRVERLADRPEGFRPPNARHFESSVPLPEVIAASTGHSQASKNGQRLYADLLRRIGPELVVLRQAPLDEIRAQAGALVAEGVRRLREGQVEIQPGYDGEYGRVQIIEKAEFAAFSGQLSLLPGPEKGLKRPASPPRASKAAKNAATEAALAQNEEAFAENLNPEQEEAVLSPSPVIAVIAGPGTGKTRTLVSRIARLIESGVPASEIVALTFTNKAAAEMRARLKELLGGEQKMAKMRIGTFHSVCLKLLAAKESPAILDSASAASLLGEVMEERGLKLNLRDALGEISLVKNGAKALDKADYLPAGLYEAYCERLAQYGALDYDDILLQALGAEQSGATPHILVDEFQDTNPLQYALLRKWSEGCRSLFVIGDPDQSIYGFRGADSRCFEWIQQDFPASQTIRLLQNYRSTPEILRCAAGVLEVQSGPGLRAQRQGGEPVRLFQAGSLWPRRSSWLRRSPSSLAAPTCWAATRAIKRAAKSASAGFRRSLSSTAPTARRRSLKTA